MSRALFLAVKPRKIGTAKEAVARMYEQAGGVERVLVKLAGAIKKTTAYAYTDNDCPDEISFARVCALTEPGVTGGAEYLALLAGGVFLPIAPENADLNKLCADASRANGEAIAAFVEALQVGKLKQGAARLVIPKIDAALQALTGLRAVALEQTRPPKPE